MSLTTRSKGGALTLSFVSEEGVVTMLLMVCADQACSHSLSIVSLIVDMTQHAAVFIQHTSAVLMSSSRPPWRISALVSSLWHNNNVKLLQTLKLALGGVKSQAEWPQWNSDDSLRHLHSK